MHYHLEKSTLTPHDGYRINALGPYGADPVILSRLTCYAMN